MNNFKSLFGKKDNDDYDNYYGRDDEMDDDVTPEQMEKEIARSKAVTAVAETIVRNGELAYKVMVHMNEYRSDGELAPVPKMLESRNA